MAEKNKGIIAMMAETYHLEQDEFIKTIKATCGLKSATNEEFLAFLVIARDHNLNPIAHEIYAFPKQGGGIQIVASIDGWIKIANRHPMHDGIETKEIFGAGGELIAVICRVWRKDRKVPTTSTEYLKENKRDTGPWKNMPSRMLTHRAKAQAIRTAYGMSGIMDEDEAAAYLEKHPTTVVAETPLDLIADSIPDAPAPKAKEPEPEPPKEDPFIDLEQQDMIEGVIVNGGWPVRAIPEVLQKYAGVQNSSEIKLSQLMDVIKAITEAAENRRAAKAKDGAKDK